MAHSSRIPVGRLWLRAALFSAALLAALGGLHVLLREADWWFLSAAIVIVVMVAVTVGRQLLTSSWLPPVAGVGVAVLALTVGFAADTASVGIIPTAGTLERFGQLIDSGQQAIRTQAIPATAPTGLTFLIVILMLIAALIGESLVARAPALAALPLLVILGVPMVIRADITDPVVFVIVVLIYLALLRVGRRFASGSAVAATGAAMLIGALLAPIMLPPVDASSAPVAGLGGRGGLNPLIDLGADLRRGNPVTAIRYVTNADAGIYLRLATLDSFDGQIWRPAVAAVSNETSVETPFPTPKGLQPAVARTVYAVTVEVGDVSGNWLPVPYPTTSLAGLEGDWFWEPQGLAVRTVRGDARGQNYDAEFLAVSPTREQLAVSVPDPGGRSMYIRLPELPAIVAETALDVAGSAATSYEIALALQAFFTSGAFRYSEDAPVEQGFDGAGLAVLAEFLVQREGYCVHFASAMAVMARSLGIPARVAVGFQPGVPSTENGVTVYTVSSHDLHAWPELFFDGIGWLRFEPTPGRGETPDYTPVEAVDDPATPQIEGEVPAAIPGGVPSARPDGFGPQLDEPGDTGTSSTTTGRPLLISLAGLGLVSLLLCPALVRVAIRTRRFRAMRFGRDASAAAWAEVRDTARDHGWSAPESETARDLADRLEVVLTREREQVQRLRARVEAIAYAPPDAGEMSLDDLRAVRAAIIRSSSARTRVRAVLLAPSLLVRLGIDPDSS